MTGTSGDGPGERGDVEVGGIKPLAVSDPARIGPYLLLGRLGSGGMGRVFLARSDSGRTVAVKVVHEEHVADGHFKERFRREIEAARRVPERYTTPVLDAGPDDEPPWVATGYVPGLSLDQVVRRHGPLPTASVHALAEGLLRALGDIHGAGIVHRDLKPSNVMLTVDGAKVIDFGVARALETSAESFLTSTGMAVGSPGFMSPEQVRGQRAGARSDVFTLGGVLTYAATARLPFGQEASNQHAVMFQIVEDEPDLTGIEDAALRELIARCLAKDVEERPDVGELLVGFGGMPYRTSGGDWLPAGVVSHLARQSARLLDAEAVPLREAPADPGTIGLRASPVDLATVGLRRQEELAGAAGHLSASSGPSNPSDPSISSVASGSALAGGESAGQHAPRRRRRRGLVALAIVAVLAAGGGSVALLQSFGSDGSNHATETAGGEGAGADSAGPTGQGDASASKEAEDKRGKDTDREQGKGGAGEPDATESASRGAGATGGADASSTPGAGGDGGSDSSGSDSEGSSSGSGDEPGGSPPSAVSGFTYKYTAVSGCVGVCPVSLTVRWSAVSGATSYDIHYTNDGAASGKKVDTRYSTGSTSYTIKGPEPTDRVCVTVRAVNRYGASAWAPTKCESVPS
ncbi:protein kinase [Streptomyces sp. A7024]|uniref:Protein kinase n=1 Tax=Streptomyces coryli TaxID=1128680 RepID=A0A6G4TSS4_9ACTN|nr:protein kinase [Streptomyces coryli]NGN62516.1 protein kinase [Streptomyces coryli]